MPTITVENYLKQLYIEQQDDPEGLVPMGRLASTMSVVPGTATAMVKTLAEAGLVDYEPRNGARLTPRGQDLALRVLRRHRLVELFLVDVLGLDWSEVHEEAEHLEHTISDKVLDRIDRLLGSPTVDPHGDPIPSARGDIEHPALPSLGDCEPDTPLRIARILDQDPSFLQFVERQGLRPGSAVRIEQRDEVADAVTIRTANDTSITLGSTAAKKILVEPDA